MTLRCCGGGKRTGLPDLVTSLWPRDDGTSARNQPCQHFDVYLLPVLGIMVYEPSCCLLL